MEFTIKSRKLARNVVFSIPGDTYIFVDLSGNGSAPGTLGQQICQGGRLSGSTIAYNGDDNAAFEAICKRWFKLYVAEADATPAYYIAETDATGAPHWSNATATSAQTLEGAKRAAARAQSFQGTTLWVCNDRLEPLAVRRADALDMNARPVWSEIDG